MRFIIIMLTFINYVKTGHYSLCQIHGVDETDWYYGKHFKFKIPDNQESSFVQFSTQNIIRIQNVKSTYLNASYSDNILNIFPNNKFKLYDEEFKTHGSSLIDLALTFECLNNTSETMIFSWNVEDVNDNAPIFNKEIYEYHFGMTIPEDYYLTNLLPISATDADFTNHDIYFTIEFNTDILLQYQGKPKHYNNIYFSSLRSLKELKAPFWREFTLVATDSGVPPRQSSTRLIVSVLSNTTRNNGYMQKLFFSKSVYIAQYFLNHLQIQEPITVNSPGKVVIKQRGFQDYFMCDMHPTNSGVVDVKVLRPLSENLLKSKKFIIIEIDAVDEHKTESTVLIIRLQNINGNMPKSVLYSVSQHCLGFYENSLFFLPFYFALILFTFIVNRRILLLYLNCSNKRSKLLR